MQEIKCPNCQKVFQVDEAGYAAIVKQVRDKEFKKDIEAREAEIHKNNDKDLKILKEQHNNELIAALKKKDDQINTLKENHVNKINEVIQENTRLTAEMSALKKTIQDAVDKAKLAKDKEIEKLQSDLRNAKIQTETQIKLAEKNIEESLKKTIYEKDMEINQLQSDLKSNETKHSNDISQLEKTYKTIIDIKDDEIDKLKNYKAMQSTKMIGESLEQHCSYEFNRVRALGFKNAYFEKDNDASKGSKGDFIFREFDDEDNEIISIMFDMKNESEDTVKKHKNEDFFKKLDKDRTDKNCEFAVLVSLLEADNPLYNQGIVDVSHRYPKMYVVRPQFFIPIITLLRNAALNAAKYKKELKKVQAQNRDFNNFNKNLDEFKRIFGNHCKDAIGRFNDSIEQIDATIELLKKVKANLQKCGGHLDNANKKLISLSVQSLAKNSPTLLAEIAEQTKDE